MNFWKNLKKPIFGLSPMDGVTDFPMREIYSKIAKPDVLYTEFVSVEGLVKDRSRFVKPLTYSISQRPIVAQLFGQSPASFAEAVKIVIDLGFDGVDINMGCPAKKVVLKNAGGALIGNYDLSDKIIRSCLNAAKNFPVSIKTRILDNKWYEFLSNYNLSAVCLHGRFLKQGLCGIVNWDEIKKASGILKRNDVIVLGNGGLLNRTDAILKINTYNLDGVLFGRNSLGNPWIFNDQGFSNKDIFDAIMEHANIAWNFFGERGYVTVAKHFGWYCKNFKGAKNLRQKLILTRSFAQTQKLIMDYYDKIPTNIPRNVA